MYRTHRDLRDPFSIPLLPGPYRPAPPLGNAEATLLGTRCSVTLDFPSPFVRVEGFVSFFDQPASSASVLILDGPTQLAAATTGLDGRYTCTFILEESKTLTVDLTYATPTSPPYTKHCQQSLQASAGTFTVDFPSNFLIVEGTVTYGGVPAAGAELGFYLDGHTAGWATADAAGFYRQVFELDQDSTLEVEMIYTIPSPPGCRPSSGAR